MYNDRISIGFDSAILTTGDGTMIEFTGKNHMIDPNTATMRFQNESEHMSGQRTFQYENPEMLLESVRGCENTYIKFGDSFLLTSVKDTGGHRVDITRYQDGRIAMVSNAKIYFELHWSHSSIPRLISISIAGGRPFPFLRLPGSRIEIDTQQPKKLMSIEER